VSNTRWELAFMAHRQQLSWLNHVYATVPLLTQGSGEYARETVASVTLDFVETSLSGGTLPAWQRPVGAVMPL
jgi:hypothetical protein